MKAIILKIEPLEYQTYPIFGDKIITFSELDMEKINSEKPVKWDGQKVIYIEETENTESKGGK